MVAKSGLLRKRSEALSDGLSEESNVIGARGVVVGDDGDVFSEVTLKVGLSSSPATLSIDERGPGNSNSSSSTLVSTIRT